MNLFVYGTLMVPEVMSAVCGHRRRGQLATLPGYRRRQIVNEVYPAIVPCAVDQVQGICYSGLDAAQGRLLDSFEGDMYRRHKVTIDTAAGVQSAYTYVLESRFRMRFSQEPWSLESFVATHLDAFVRDYHGFAALSAED